MSEEARKKFGGDSPSLRKVKEDVERDRIAAQLANALEQLQLTKSLRINGIALLLELRNAVGISHENPWVEGEDLIYDIEQVLRYRNPPETLPVPLQNLLTKLRENIDQTSWDTNATPW